MSDRDQLERLFLTRHPCVLVSTYEEEYLLKLLGEMCVERGCELWVWSVTRGLRDGLLNNSPSVPDTEQPAGVLFYLSREAHRGAIHVMLDLAGFLKDERTMRALREAVGRMAEQESQLILIDSEDCLPPAARALGVTFEPSLPDEEELQALVRSTLRQLNDERRIEVHLNRKELETMIRNLQGLTRRQARQIIYDAVCDDCRLDASDINRMMAGKRKQIGDGVLEYVESPVSLDQIGGLSRLKQWLLRRQDCMSKEAAAFGLTAPRGILMLGVQGSGKSLSAKAVATAWERPLLRLDAGALYDRYIGESERRLRDALRQAERLAPVVLWIDEIEKGFASAASQSSDGGLSKRMFGTLLTWMQEHTAPVFLVATANDIEALPPELLRKGRFDEIFFIDLPNLEARTAIISIHLQKRKRDPKNFDVAEIAQAAEGFSGAEIEQAIISALHDAFAAHEELTTRHIVAALKASPPLSVTMSERLAALQAWAAGRCVPAD